MSAALGAGKEFTQATMDNLGGRAAGGCNGIQIAMHFGMKLKKGIRFFE